MSPHLRMAENQISEKKKTLFSANKSAIRSNLKQLQLKIYEFILIYCLFLPLHKKCEMTVRISSYGSLSANQHLINLLDGRQGNILYSSAKENHLKYISDQNDLKLDKKRKIYQQFFSPSFYLLVLTKVAASLDGITTVPVQERAKNTLSRW